MEVTRGEFYISASTDRYVYKPGDEAIVNVEMATFDGDRPVARPFTVQVMRTWWEKVPADTAAEPEYRKRSETIWNGSGATDASGKGRTPYPATRAGYFEVAITARDANSDAMLDMFDFANPPFATPPSLPEATVDEGKLATCKVKFPK